MHHDIELSKKGEAYALRHNPTGCPEGIEPRLWREAVSRRVETHLALATALIALLDGQDGDCDLEDNADHEPSLGGGDFRGEVDLELDNCDDEDGDPAEPSLGAIEPMTFHVAPFGWMGERNGYEERFASGHQLDWGRSGRLDLEVGDGDDEPDVDDEPSLGSPELGPASQYVYADEKGNLSVFHFHGSQAHWADGAGDMEEEAVNEDGDDGYYAA